MRVLFDWLRCLGRVAGLKQGSNRRGLLVERLEPRQMLAADCFFMVEIFPTDSACDEPFAQESYVSSWTWEESGWNEASPRLIADSDGSVFQDFDEYYLVHLEDVLDEIGQLHEVRETSFGSFDHEDFPWFS